MAIDSGPYKPFGRYLPLIDAVDAAEFTGIDLETIQEAVSSGELKTAHKRSFRVIDLAAWTEELRFRNLEESSPKWQKHLYDFGFVATDDHISEAYLDNLRLASEYAHAGDPRYTNPTYQYNIDGERTIWRFLRLYNIDIVDEVLFGWNTLHEIGTTVFKGTPYVIDNVALVCRKPRTAPIPRHSDIITVVRDNVQYPAILVSVDLNDVPVKDGGVLFLPKSHRIQNGRMIDLPATNDNFESLSTIAGQVKIHNSGVIHTTTLNLTQQVRFTFYVTLVSHDAGSYRSTKYNRDNVNYVFNA